MSPIQLVVKQSLSLTVLSLPSMFVVQLVLNFVVRDLVARMMLYGFHRLFPVKVLCQLHSQLIVHVWASHYLVCVIFGEKHPVHLNKQLFIVQQMPIYLLHLTLNIFSQFLFQNLFEIIGTINDKLSNS